MYTYIVLLSSEIFHLGGIFWSLSALPSHPPKKRKEQLYTVMSSVLLESEISEGGFASSSSIYKCWPRHKIPRTISSNSVFWFTLLKMRNLKSVILLCQPFSHLSRNVHDFLFVFGGQHSAGLCFSLHLSFVDMQVSFLLILGESLLFYLATESTFNLAPVFPGHTPFFEAFFFFLITFLPLTCQDALGSSHLAYLVPQPWNQSFLQIALVSLIEGQYQKPRSGHQVCLLLQESDCFKALCEQSYEMYTHLTYTEKH